MDDTILTDGNADSDGAATDMIVMATPGLSRHQRALFSECNPTGCPAADCSRPDGQQHERSRALPDLRGRPAEHRCRRCGALVCPTHYDEATGLCTECAADASEPGGDLP